MNASGKIASIAGGYHILCPVIYLTLSYPMPGHVPHFTVNMPRISHKCGLVQALVTARALLRQPRQCTPGGVGHELERLKEIAREINRLTRYGWPCSVLEGYTVNSCVHHSCDLGDQEVKVTSISRGDPTAIAKVLSGCERT